MALKRKGSVTALVGALVAAPFVLFYAAFVCGVPVVWPYYVPRLEGAEIIDRSTWYLPRAGMAPIARFPLRGGAFADIATRCYPLRDGEHGQCALTIRFAAPLDADIAFAETPVVARSPDGRNVVDIEHYVAFADRYRLMKRANVVRDGEVYLTFSDFLRSGSVLLTADAGPEYTARIPDILIDGRPVPVPPVRFTRVDDLTCHGIFTNF